MKSIDETSNLNNFRMKRLLVMFYSPRYQTYLNSIIPFQSEKKLWRVSIVILLSWSLTWSPYAFVFLACAAGKEDLIDNHLGAWTCRTWFMKIFYLILFFQQYSASSLSQSIPWYMDSCNISMLILITNKEWFRLPNFKRQFRKLTSSLTKRKSSIKSSRCVNSRTSMNRSQTTRCVNVKL